MLTTTDRRLQPCFQAGPVLQRFYTKFLSSALDNPPNNRSCLATCLKSALPEKRQRSLASPPKKRAVQERHTVTHAIPQNQQRLKNPIDYPIGTLWYPGRVLFTVTGYLCWTLQVLPPSCAAFRLLEPLQLWLPFLSNWRLCNKKAPTPQLSTKKGPRNHGSKYRMAESVSTPPKTALSFFHLKRQGCFFGGKEGRRSGALQGSGIQI